MNVWRTSRPIFQQLKTWSNGMLESFIQSYLLKKRNTNLLSLRGFDNPTKFINFLSDANKFAICVGLNNNERLYSWIISLKKTPGVLSKVAWSHYTMSWHTFRSSYTFFNDWCWVILFKKKILKMLWLCLRNQELNGTHSSIPHTLWVYHRGFYNAPLLMWTCKLLFECLPAGYDNYYTLN